MKARTKAEIVLLSITFVWGSTFVTTKYVLQYITPFLYVAIRFGLAGVLFGALFYKQLRDITRSTLRKGVVLGVLLFVGFALQTIGLQYTTASKSAFITGMLVVLTPICQIVIERKSPKLGNILGVILVTIGLFLLTSPTGSEINTGDVLTLGCALCFAFYIVYLDVYSKEPSAAQLTFLQFVVSAIAGTICAMVFENVFVVISLGLAGALMYLILFATIIALYAQTKFQKETTPTRAAIIFASEPVIAALFAYELLGEKLGWIGILGAALILTGLFVSELSDIIFQSSSKGNSVSS